MMMTSRFSLGVTVLLSASVLNFGGVALAEGWSPGDEVTLRAAAGRPVHSVYAVHVGHKSIVERELPGLRLDLQASQGGSDNAALLFSGEVEMASGNAAGGYALHHGQFAFEDYEPFPDMVTLFPAYSLQQGVIVMADSPVQTFRDCVGRRLGLTPAGSGAEVTAMNQIEALGLTESDFRSVSRMADAQGFAGLVSGSLDCFFWGTAHPGAALMEQKAVHDLRLVPVEEDDLKAVAEMFPYLPADYVRANMYDDQPNDVPWAGGMTNFWVNANTDEELVYHYVKAVWENRDELLQTHASQQYLNEDLVRMAGSIVPYHAGAERYFREIGILE